MFQRTVFILIACSLLVLPAAGVARPETGQRSDVVWEGLPGWITGAKTNCAPGDDGHDERHLRQPNLGISFGASG